MTDRERMFNGKPLSEVANVMAGCMTNSQNDQAAKAEFFLRQTEAQIQTASATVKYTRYMFWSVVVLALASIANLIVVLVK